LLDQKVTKKSRLS